MTCARGERACVKLIWDQKGPEEPIQLRNFKDPRPGGRVAPRESGGLHHVSYGFYAREFTLREVFRFLYSTLVVDKRFDITV
jgi:hypothetical protein